MGMLAWIGVFYVVPFVILAAMPGWRSLGVGASLAGAALTALWINHLRHYGEGNGFAQAMGEAAIAMLTVAVVTATIGRGCTLIWRNSPNAWRTSGVLVATFLAAPAGLWGSGAYSDWKRRPPSAECAARESFALRFGDVVLRVPNTPLTLVRAQDDVFALATAPSIRRLCAATDGANGPLEAQTITLFVGNASRERRRAEMERWLTKDCPTAAPASVRLVCSPDHPTSIDQLTIYGKADFPNRVISVGRAPSYAFFKQQKALGLYPPNSGTERGGAIVYPNGAWSMDGERSIVSCGDRYSYGRPCSTDVPLTDGLNAKVNFNVRDDDVEGAFREAKASVLELYREWSVAAESRD